MIKSQKGVTFKSYKIMSNLKTLFQIQISRNWSNQINNIKKNGPSNKRRGRKQRTTFSKVDFKTAKDLKKIGVSIDQEAAETNTIATGKH